jgi:gliding motility-associated-like protein
MKKTIPFLIISLLTVTFGFSQTYQPWHEATGGPNFNTISAPYVKCTYSTSMNWSGDSEPPLCTTPGINQSSGRVSHRLVTVDGVDPCRCAGLGINNSAPYFHENILPPDWSMDNNLPSQDTVVMLGCNDCSSGCAVCTEHAQIEYWFYPTEENSTLLVMFTFAEEDAPHNAYGSGTLNPQFWIEVLDGETGQLIPSDCYKRANGTSNPNWPYNRFMACPDGNQWSESFSTPEDEFGIKTYYWAHPKATPTTFPFRRCPSSQTSGHTSSNVDAGWFEYKPIAFNLSSYAEQGRSVKLRIRVYACTAEYHWAYCMFTAKMIPSAIHVDACGGDNLALSVPAGFRTEGSYIWRYGYYSLDACAPNRLLNVDNPPAGVTVNGLYDIFIDRDAVEKLWPYYRCEMISYTGAPFIYEAHIKSYYIEPDFTFEQNFDNCNLSGTLHDSSTIFTEIPPTQAGGQYDTIYQQTQFIKWYVKRYNNFEFIAQNTTDVNFTFDSTTVTSDGLATFMIVVQDEEQKCIDTIEKTIQLDLTAVQHEYAKDTVVICEEKLPYVYDPEHFQDQYTWTSPNDTATRRVCYEGMAWNGCNRYVDVTLIVRKPKVDIVFDQDYCDEFTTTLSTVPEEEFVDFLWGPDGQTDPRITITAPGTYSVTVYNADTCSASGSMTIPACTPFLNLPNSITPGNQDGVNDYFYIPQRNLIQSLEFTVYNRNGEMVYHTTNKEFEWNGAVNGRIFSGATYTYTLTITNYEGVTSKHKGSITVL